MNTTIITILDVICKRIRKSQKKTLASIVESLLHGSTASLAEIARGMGKRTKFCSRLKRVWRYLGNSNIDGEKGGEELLDWFISRRNDEPLVLLVDWSKFYTDNVLAAVPMGKRAIPIFWEIATKEDLSNKGQNVIEKEFFKKVRGLISREVKVIIVADRGFGRTSLFSGLDKYGFGYVIRIKDAGWVREKTWQGVLASFPLKLGSIFHWEDVGYHKTKRYKLNIIMRKDIINNTARAWYLATNIPDQAAYLLNLYERRMWIEEMFRDLKSSNFNLDKVRLKNTERRSRLLFAISLSSLLATVIGQHYSDKKDYSFVEGNSNKEKLGFSIFRLGMQALKSLGKKVLDAVWIPILQEIV